MIDYSGDRLTVNEFSKKAFFHMLKEQKVYEEYDEKIYEFKLSDLRELTYNLMHFTDINYVNFPVPSDKETKSDFTDEELRLFYPFALVLACLDGNAFVNIAEPQRDAVLSYVPEAYKVLAANGLKIDRINEIIKALKEFG